MLVTIVFIVFYGYREILEAFAKKVGTFFRSKTADCFLGNMFLKRWDGGGQGGFEGKLKCNPHPVKSAKS